jgi:hypothetical protein
MGAPFRARWRSRNFDDVLPACGRPSRRERRRAAAFLILVRASPIPAARRQKRRSSRRSGPKWRWRCARHWLRVVLCRRFYHGRKIACFCRRRGRNVGMRPARQREHEDERARRSCRLDTRAAHACTLLRLSPRVRFRLKALSMGTGRQPDSVSGHDERGLSGPEAAGKRRARLARRRRFSW